MHNGRPVKPAKEGQQKKPNSPPQGERRQKLSRFILHDPGRHQNGHQGERRGYDRPKKYRGKSPFLELLIDSLRPPPADLSLQASFASFSCQAIRNVAAMTAPRVAIAP